MRPNSESHYFQTIDIFFYNSHRYLKIQFEQILSNSFSFSPGKFFLLVGFSYHVDFSNAFFLKLVDRFIAAHIVHSKF